MVPEAEGGELQGVGVRSAATPAGGFIVLHDLVPGRLDRPLDRTGWRVSATHRPEEAHLAIDGRPETRWGTGEAQRPGMAFTVDLGRLEEVGGLTLDARPLPGDLPRGLRLETSEDGERWEAVQLEWRGEAAWDGWTVRRLSGGGASYGFPPRRARLVRLSLSGAAEAHWWSIHELRLYAP